MVPRLLVVVHRFVVKAETHSVDKDGVKLWVSSAATICLELRLPSFNVIHTVRSRVRGPIKDVSSIQAVFIRELMVDPSRNEVSFTTC